MIRPESRITLLIAFFFVSSIGVSQPVKWTFIATSVGYAKYLVRISAAIPDGWHLYSQHLEDGGPQPTRILFDPSKSFYLLGRPEETGTCASFYDSLYEMQITWYTRTAVFEQEVLLHDPKAT